MPLRDIFKKKKKPEESKKTKRSKEAEAKEEIVIPRKERKTVIHEAYRIFKFPHITEKATELAKRNQYVFQVFKRTNKTEIKKEIENLFGVDVLNVRIINVPRKPRRLGRQRGYKPEYKKAIVKIREGQKIEIMPR